MKNKGRRHKAAYNEKMDGIANAKSILVILTRPINQMSSRNNFLNPQGVSKKWFKKKWNKRVRGYFKSQTKEII